MLSRVKRDAYQYFGQQKLFKRFGRWAQWTNLAPVLADVVFPAGFFDRDVYRFVPYFRYSGICPVVIDRLKILVR